VRLFTCHELPFLKYKNALTKLDSIVWDDCIFLSFLFTKNNRLINQNNMYSSGNMCLAEKLRGIVRPGESKPQQTFHALFVFAADESSFEKSKRKTVT